MKDRQLGIYPITYSDVTDTHTLMTKIYPNMQQNYYWSEDFSPKFYIAQAQAGFIAVTDTYEGKELLLPEIQFSYAVLHFENLHTSTKVRKLLRKKQLQLKISTDISPVIKKIRSHHKRCWLTPRYEAMLLQTQKMHEDFHLIESHIEEDGAYIAGEIGYIIGDTYTSLSGFSSREKHYRNYGTAQLVLLAHYLKENGFAFWNLGQSYMPYKFALGSRVYERRKFLNLWYTYAIY